jgi:hypothetical protein
VNTKKICKTLNITQRTLNNYLHKLIENGILEISHRGYRTDRYTMTYKFTEGHYPTTQEIIETSININEDYTINTNETKLTSDSELLLTEIQRMTEEVNKWSPIKFTNSCRFVEWKTGKIKFRTHQDFRGRVYNNLCFTKSGKKIYKKQDFRVNRNDYLNHINLKNYGEVYDIKSEIPRLSHYLQFDIEFFQIKDYYNYFLTNTGFNTGNIRMNRDDVKSLFMRCYFSNDINTSYRYYTYSVKNKYGGYSKDSFTKLYDEIRKIKPMGNEIFLWTSLLELYILDDVYKRTGNKLVNVYDGFYFEINKKSEIQKEIEKSILIVSKKNKNLYLTINKLNNKSDNNLIINTISDNLYNKILNNTVYNIIPYVETTSIDNQIYLCGNNGNTKTNEILNTDTELHICGNNETNNIDYKKLEKEYLEWCKTVPIDGQWSYEEYLEIRGIKCL